MPDERDIPCPKCGVLNEKERETCWECYSLLNGKAKAEPEIAPRRPAEVAPAPPRAFNISIEIGEPSGRQYSRSNDVVALVLLLFLIVAGAIGVGWGCWVKVKLLMDGRTTAGTLEFIGRKKAYYHYNVPGDRPGASHNGRTYDTWSVRGLMPGTTFPLLYSASDPGMSAPAESGWFSFFSDLVLVLALMALCWKLALSQWRKLGGLGFIPGPPRPP